MKPAARAWRLILGSGTTDWTPDSGARNMALDHALLESVQAGAAPVLRLYRWQPACLSFGRNQLTRGIYDPQRTRAAGIDVARRPTGGLAVLHDRELTYCVAAPLHVFGGPRAAYAAINGALVDGLRRLGVPASLAVGRPRRGPLFASAEPCFQTPAAGEVIARGRKLIGSAQRAQHGALLQHGSILLGGNQADLLGLLIHGGNAAMAGAGSITLHELMGRELAWEQLTATIVQGFEHLCGTRLAPQTLGKDEATRAAALEASYRSDSWTWRR